MTAEEKAEENYTKVYLNGDISLDTEEKYFAYTKGYCKGYTDGLAEGRKENEVIIDTQTVQIESRDVYLAEKENIILRQQAQIEKMKCCGNCKHLKEEHKENCVFINSLNTICCNKWEIAE